MHNSSSKRKTLDATSSRQLDFDWPLFTQKSPKKGDATTEAAASTIGRRSLLSAPKVDRLFVPLADQPFAWFRSGKKKWELRRLGRQYTPKHVRVGRRVELRRGYKGPDVLWGEILEVILANGLEDFLSKVCFKKVVPVAESREDAVEIATKILNVEPKTPLLGFSVGDL
jgi:ASC-1-like (ASCH) protein